MGLFRLLVVFTLITFLHAGCTRKASESDFPKLGNVVCTALPDGTADLTGEVAQAGDGAMIFLGFAIDTVENVKVDGWQKSVEVMDGNKYHVIADDLDANKTYYCRAIIANEHGYAMGEVIKMPRVTITATSCTPADDTYTIDNGVPDHFITVFPYKATMFEYEMDLEAGLATFHLVFGRKPTTGVYTITNYNITHNSVFKGREVGITYYPVGTPSVFTGGKLYVNQNGGNGFTAVICGGQFYTSQVDSHIMNGKFTLR